MKALYPLVAVTILILLALMGVGLVDGTFVFGILIPYAAIATFLAGFVYRILRWASVPVPFHIVTTTGQQKSLPWIKSSFLESPAGTLGVIGRMLLEILFFRSLFRNVKASVKGRRVVFGEDMLLWLAGLAFHWSMLVVLIRHWRFFTQPVPVFVDWLQNVDGFFQFGLPVVYASTALILLGLGYLLVRRLFTAQVRYISLAADYFPLFLILSIAGSGALMRHIWRVDIVAVKELAISLVSFRPEVPAGIGPIFYVHLFLVSTLVAYFPFSKLMHLGGVFLSPTRNLANNNRMRRHVNPWNYPVNVHTYDEWEEEFKDKLIAAGYELDHPEEKALETVGGKGH